MELQAEFIYPRSAEDLAADEPREGIRVTVGQASMLDVHRYRKLAAEAWAWFWEQTQAHWQPGGKDLKAIPDDDPAFAILDVGQRRAYMLACLRKVETLHRAHGESEVWQAGQLPTDWATIEGMAHHCPASLFGAWAQAVLDCNPGLFWVDTSDAKNSNGGASVRTPGRS